MTREYGTSKAALQPPEEKGEDPVTVLVTGFGVIFPFIVRRYTDSILPPSLIHPDLLWDMRYHLHHGVSL